MVFLPPSWAPPLPEIPNVSLCDFIFDERYGRGSFKTSLPAYVDGITGREVSIVELKDNVDKLARGLASELAWTPNRGDELSKVVAIFALNTVRLLSQRETDSIIKLKMIQVDIPALTWAIHKIGRELNGFPCIIADGVHRRCLCSCECNVHRAGTGRDAEQSEGESDLHGCNFIACGTRSCPYVWNRIPADIYL